VLSEPARSPASPADAVVFLLDADNTLLDNDRFGADLSHHLDETFGAAERARYWKIFVERRERLGLADYIGSLELFRTRIDNTGIDDNKNLLGVAEFLMEYPFSDLIYPQAMPTISHLATLGKTVVLSDGDVMFQPRKIRRAGLWDAVMGRVLVYLHKEKSLAHVQKVFPASHYVAVDDKPNLLAAMKAALGDKLTTIFVRQGHYALDVQAHTELPPPDRVIERIGDLMKLNLTDIQVRP
jgi:FMN phosphatase YigB (HAD superfamily)